MVITHINVYKFLAWNPSVLFVLVFILVFSVTAIFQIIQSIRMG